MRHLSTDLRRRNQRSEAVGQSSSSASVGGGTRGGRRWLSSFVPLTRRSSPSNQALEQPLQSCQDNEASSPMPVRLRHPHLTPLFYEVRSHNWPDVIRRCQTRPHEAWVQEDISGETPLHCACRFDPPADVVRSLIEAASTYIGESLTNGDEGVTMASAVVREVRNAEGATALHVSCSHRASEACIRALLEPARQNAAKVSSAHSLTRPPRSTAALTKTGRTPLHYACMSFRGLGVDAFRALLEATVADQAAIFTPHPTNVAATIDCKLPAADDLYLDAEFEGAEDAIDCEEEEKDRQHAPPGSDLVTLRDSTGQAPLGLLFRRYRERVRCVIKMVEQSTMNRDQASASSRNSSSVVSSNSMNAAAQAVRADLGELWEKARLIVSTMAEQQGRKTQEQESDDQSWEEVKDDEESFLAPNYCSLLRKSPSSQAKFPAKRTRKFRIVHASVGLTGYGCPPEMVRLAASVHPNQVREMDEDGNLPIHIIATASSYTHPDAEAPELVGGTCDGPNGGDDEASLSSIAASSVASTVLSVYTGATSAANSLGTSQFCAPHNPRPFDAVLRILLRHYPEGAAVPHGVTGELPLAMAARTGKRTWEDGMKTTLLAYPSALYGPEVRPPGLHACILGLLAPAGRVGSSNDILPVGVTCARRAYTLGPGCMSNGRRQRRMRSRNKAATKALSAVYELVKAQPNVIGGG
eukprot:CAMPEP_0113572558 /NCGR_PEP_ID=MMETSP0015_2-20120614/26153_1 /TAXON_ID=2838 /ORGANISM="Odontella" /LENGTH=697 /DNA_ID=CAMNT_0000475587 /DNA_START=334 /DNA_END=2427 /DNA_ORIENTATION=+ /assembly_acc=CAM_ASM_000160